MKIKYNEKLLARGFYLFLSLAATILFALVAVNFTAIYSKIGGVLGYVTPVVYAFVIAFLLNPLLKVFEGFIKWIERLLLKKGLRKNPIARGKIRGFSLVLTYLTALAFVFIFISLALPSLLKSLEGIGLQIPNYLKIVEEFITSASKWLQALPGTMPAEGTRANLVAIVSEELFNTIEGSFSNLGTWIGAVAGGAFVAASNLISGIVKIAFGVIISVYFLIDKEKLLAQLRKSTVALFPKKASEFLYDFAKESNDIFSSYIVGHLIDSLLVAVVTFIVMLFIQKDLAVLIAVIVGITNIVPYFGPFLGAIPSGLLLFAISPGKALAFFIFILILQQIDGNIIVPMILGDSLGLSPLLVVFAILLFGGLMGIPGVVLGVPLFTMIYSLLRRMVNWLLRRKELSIATRDYASEQNPLIEKKAK